METKTENVKQNTNEEKVVKVISDMVELSNALLLKSKELESFVSETFFKNTVQVMMQRIETNMERIIERSPENKLLLDKTVKLVKNPEARKELAALAKKFGVE